MSYLITRMEIDECIKLSNKKNLKYVLLGMAIAFLAGMIVAMVIIKGD